jgi:hypothetical protein
MHSYNPPLRSRSPSHKDFDFSPSLLQMGHGLHMAKVQCLFLPHEKSSFPSLDFSRRRAAHNSGHQLLSNVRYIFGVRRKLEGTEEDLYMRCRRSTRHGTVRCPTSFKGTRKLFKTHKPRDCQWRWSTSFLYWETKPSQGNSPPGNPHIHPHPISVNVETQLPNNPVPGHPPSSSYFASTHNTNT